MAQGRRPRVAVVGASPLGNMVATALLEQFGCAAVVAPTSSAVLAMLRGDDPVDLAIVDVSLPNIDGIITVQMMRALGARGALPVIALTKDEAADSPRLRAAGFAGTVEKPYSPRELFGVMHQALFPAGEATEAATGT